MLEGKYGTISTALKDIPEDEPVFLLRGQDLLAPRGIRAYADELAREAVMRSSTGLEQMAESCHAFADRVLAWQDENPTRTKLPD